MDERMKKLLLLMATVDNEQRKRGKIRAANNCN